MPAGDLLTADYQVEIRSTLTGAGTQYEIGPAGIQGLGVPPAKTHDLDLGHAAGAYAGRDYTGVRTVTIPYTIDGDDPDECGDLFVTLNHVWRASETDIELHLRVPGFGHVKLNGRPRGLVDDLRQLKNSHAEALATFVCPNPTMIFLNPGS